MTLPMWKQAYIKIFTLIFSFSRITLFKRKCMVYNKHISSDFHFIKVSQCQDNFHLDDFITNYSLLTSYVMLPPNVAGWCKDALEIEPDAERIHSSRLLCCMKNIIFCPTSYAKQTSHRFYESQYIKEDCQNSVSTIISTIT